MRPADRAWSASRSEVLPGDRLWNRATQGGGPRYPTLGIGPGDDNFSGPRADPNYLENKDILAFENYFNEPDATLGSAVWGSDQNPKSAAEYRKLWGVAPTLPGSSPGASPSGTGSVGESAGGSGSPASTG